MLLWSQKPLQPADDVWMLFLRQAGVALMMSLLLAGDEPAWLRRRSASMRTKPEHCQAWT
jgi:hypothetical protein